MYLLSMLGGGLFIIPLGFLVASAISLYKGNKQWKSGSTWSDNTGSGPLVNHESDERVNFFSIAAVRVGIALLVLSIGSLIWMLLEK